MRGMRVIARFMDARNTAEGKFLSVLLSVLLVFSFLNVTMFTDLANADDEVALGAATEIVAEIEDDGEVEEAEEAPESPEADAPEAPADEPAEEPSDPAGDDAIEPVPSAPSESDPAEEVTYEGDSGSEGDAVETPAAADDARAAELNLNAVGERGKKPELSEQNVYVYLQLTGDGVDEFVKDLNIKPNGHGYYTIGVIKAMLPTPTESMLSTDSVEKNYIGDYGEAVRAALRSGIDRWADNAGVDISGIPPEQWNKLIVSRGADRYVNSTDPTWHLDGYMEVENAINYEVRHVNEDGEEIAPKESGTTQVGTKITAENHRRSIDGYTYSSEKTQAANGGNKFIEIARGKDNVLTLVYERSTYCVTFEPGAQGTFERQVSEGIEHGAATPAPPVPTGAAGYRFMGWNPAVADQVTEDATYVAQWAREYRVTYDWTGLPTDEPFYDEEGRAVTPMLPVDASTYTKGESYQVKEAAVTKVYTHDEFGNVNARYTLGKWNLTGEQTMGEGDVTITAQWTRKEISVPTVEVRYIYTNGMNGIPQHAPQRPKNKTYVLNQPLDSVAVPTLDGWEFSGWSIDPGYEITQKDIDAKVLEVSGSWEANLSMLKATGYVGYYDSANHAVTVEKLEKDSVAYRIGELEVDNEFRNANAQNASETGATVTAVVTRDGVEIAQLPVEVSIYKRPVAIEAENSEKVFGEADPSFSDAQLTLGGPELTSAQKKYIDAELWQVEKAVSRTDKDSEDGEKAGTHRGVLSTSQTVEDLNRVLSNFTFEVIPGDFTISPREITDPVVNPEEPGDATFVAQYEASKVYNGAEQKPEVEDIAVTDAATDKTLVPGVDYEIYYRFNGSATAPADFVNVGEVTIVVRGKGNYQGQFELPYEITPAPLTITARESSKVYGAVDPEFEWVESEVLSQNGIEDEIGQVVVTRSNAGIEEAGTYEGVLVPSVEKIAQNKNYTYKFVPNNFRILQSDENDITINGINDVASQSIVKTYDGEVVAIEATAARPEGSTLEYSVDGGEWGAEVPTFLNAGVYEVAVRATNPNYETVEKTVTVVINRAPVTVTAVASGKYFGADDPSLTATVTGLVAGESESLIDYVVAREAGEAVGEYSIIPAGLATQGNYAVSYEAAPFTISLAPVVPPAVTPNPVNPPTVPTVPTVPTPAPGPAAPAVTPAAATPAPAAAAVPAVAPPVLAAPTPAPAVAEPAGEVIEDDATPQAATPSDEAGEQIEDDATPMGAFDEPHCWVHWVMMLGILLTALYGIVVVRRRLALTSDIDDFERRITGRVEETEETFVPLTGHQAL